MGRNGWKPKMSEINYDDPKLNRRAIALLDLAICSGRGLHKALSGLVITLRNIDPAIAEALEDNPVMIDALIRTLDDIRLAFKPVDPEYIRPLVPGNPRIKMHGGHEIDIDEVGSVVFGLLKILGCSYYEETQATSAHSLSQQGWREEDITALRGSMSKYHLKLRGE